MYTFFRDIFGDTTNITFNPKNKRYIISCDETKIIYNYESPNKTIKNLTGDDNLKTKFIEYLENNTIYQKILKDEVLKKQVKQKTTAFDAFIHTQINEIEKIVKQTGKINAKMIPKYRPKAIRWVINQHRKDEEKY